MLTESQVKGVCTWCILRLELCLPVWLQIGCDGYKYTYKYTWDDKIKNDTQK